MTSLPRFAPTPCAGCAGPCCRGRAVPLTGLDLCRLEDALGVPWRSLATVGVAFSGGFKLDPGPTRWAFRLQQKPGGECLFAVGDPTLRCGVHPDRPTACRIYPFHVAIRDQGPVVALGNDAACPEPEGAAWAALAGPAVVGDALAEHARWVALVERWEAQLDRRREPDELVAFVRVER